MSDLDLLVLGGGPAGVGAAQRAARTGRSVALLEARDRVGGAATSITVDGLRVDLGSHRLHRATDPDLVAELRVLLGDDLQVRPRHGRIRLADRWLPFPLRPTALASLPPGFAAAAARDTLVGLVRRDHGDHDSFAAAIRAGLGPTMLDRFYGPYAEKLWGLPPEEVDAEQARVRVGASSPAAVLRRVIAGRDPDARTFMYPRRGFGQLWEALAADAEAAGARVHLGARVTEIEPGDRDVVVRTADGTTRRARTVLSTLPLALLPRLVPDAPTRVIEAGASLRTRAMVLVYVTIAANRVTPFDAHYLPETWTPLTRLSEPKNYRDGHAGAFDPGDPADRTVLCGELPCSVGDDLWTATDTALAEHVRRVLVVDGFPPATIESVHVERIPSAYPVYDLGFGGRAAIVSDWSRSLPGVVVLGRQGLFVHDNTHHALRMAWDAIAALDDTNRIDPAAWSAALTRFKSHVVED